MLPGRCGRPSSIAVAAHAGYVAWYFLRPLKSAAPVTYFGGQASVGEEASSDTIEQRDPAQSRTIKVMADYDCHPLWALDADLVGDFPPEDIGVSAELCHDLKDWAQSFNASSTATIRPTPSSRPRSTPRTSRKAASSPSA